MGFGVFFATDFCTIVSSKSQMKRTSKDSTRKPEIPIWEHGKHKETMAATGTGRTV